jgi:putative flippase GtrA
VVVVRLRSAAHRVSQHSGIRFLIVGGLSAAVDAGSLYVLHGVLDIWLPVATAIAFLVAFGINFGLNRIWTFEATGNARWHLVRYGSLVLVNLALTVLLVQALTWLGLIYLVSKVLTTATLAVSNYFVSRRWVFD